MIDWIVDDSIPDTVIYAYDPESLVIENGILKFRKPRIKKLTKGKKITDAKPVLPE